MDPQLLQSIQTIARYLRPQFWPQSLVEWAQVVLVLLTGVTLCFLWKYTKETVELRRATRDQVETSNLQLKESQVQNEHSLMPIVVLATALEEGGRNEFFLKNTGAGPALNTRTAPFSLDPATKFTFHHRAVIPASDQESASLRIAGRPGNFSPEALVNVLTNHPPETELHTWIRYQAVSGKWYETSHTLKLTSSRRDLIIHFDKFIEIQTPAD